MVKHIKKAYSKDGKLTDREKSIAYATAWKHHNEETEHTTHAKDVVKVGKDTIKIPKSAKKDLDKISKARDKDWWKHQDKAGYMGETREYDPTPGGMEWGTDKGDDYYRDLTPGQERKNKKEKQTEKSKGKLDPTREIYVAFDLDNNGKISFIEYKNGM